MGVQFGISICREQVRLTTLLFQIAIRRLMSSETSTKGETLNPFVTFPRGRVKLGPLMGQTVSGQCGRFEERASEILQDLQELNPEYGAIKPKEAVSQFRRLLGDLRCVSSFTEVYPDWQAQSLAFYKAIHRLAKAMDLAYEWGEAHLLSVRALEANVKEALMQLDMLEALKQLDFLEEVVERKTGSYID